MKTINRGPHKELLARSVDKLGERNSYATGPGADCLADQDEKHILEHEARIQGYIDRVGIPDPQKTESKISDSGELLLGTLEIANEVGFCDHTISSWRKRFGLPSYIKKNGKRGHLFKLDEVIAWMRANGKTSHKVK